MQHADDDPEFQERALELMQAAVDAGDADPQQLAFVDRVCVAQGRAQVFDARRAAVGLAPFADYAARFRTPRRANT